MPLERADDLRDELRDFDALDPEDFLDEVARDGFDDEREDPDRAALRDDDLVLVVRADDELRSFERDLVVVVRDGVDLVRLDDGRAEDRDPREL